MFSISRQRFGPIIPAWSLLLFCFSHAGAERLPLRAYTTADGLPNNTINKIVADSRGFLWFCTDEGLSRFDGYEFTNYGTNHGLPHPVVNDFLETRDGEYWVATTGGLSKFNPRGEPTNRVIYADSPRGKDPREPMFTVYKLRAEDRYNRAITTLLERRDGTLWYGTNNGLFRIARQNGQINLLPVEAMSPGSTGQRLISSLVEDGHGTLWIGGPGGLHRLWPDGTFASYGRKTGLPDTYIHDLLNDHKGNLWVATRHGGLAQLAVTAAGPPVGKHIYNDKNGLPSNWTFDLFQSANGKLWVGTNLGLCEFLLDDSGNGNLARVYTRRNGFSYHEIVNIAEDREGNLWLGLENAAMKLARNGFTTFEERDGVCCVRSFFRSEAGEFFAYAYLVPNPETSRVAATNYSQSYSLRLGRFDGQQFTWLLPDALMTKYPGWSTELTALQARTGEWWIGTGEGLYQFPPVKNFAALQRARPAAIYSTRDGMRTEHVYCLFEDSRGDLWISSIGPSNGLARWERTTRKVQDMSNTPGLPSLKEKLATVFQEDSGGNLWVGFNDGFLGRYSGGRFKLFTPEDGLPAGRVEDLFTDHRGNLWAAMGRGGLSRVDNPTAAQPTFVNYTTAEGLATNYVTAVTEDLYGRIYIATGQGIDRLEPATGRIRHYTTADGLALGRVLSATRDGQGVIWVGTLSGMSWLRPEPVEPTVPPPILIKGLRVAGTPHNVSAIGETEIYLPELQANENQLEIDFVGLSFAPGESLRYQYRLEGANNDWSAPTGQRTINFANLAPGRYRFLVRGLNSDDVTSPQPATISFTILPPVWQRWWFLTLLAMTIGLVAYALYRYRVRRLVELERVRTRIAGDLHDDIGAGLSRIAILSELGRQETGRGPGSERLSAIARASRELVDSMSDIVWTINPERDQLRDLIQRMRRFASDIFTARGINFSFRAPTEDRNLKVGADVRRHVYLVFKESVNNAVRHSGCTEAQIDLVVEANSFVLVIKDNGRGFDPGQVGDGNGLVNMRERARIVGAQFRIDSANGHGTTVTLRVPFRATVKEPAGRLGRRRKE